MFNLLLQFTEEINRMLTDHISSYFFSPSRHPIDNLRKEGIEEGVYFAGKLMYDTFVQMQPDFRTNVVQELGLELGNFVILTLHRDFNVDDRDRLAAILQSMAEIQREMPVAFPMHPRTKQCVEAFGLSDWLCGWKAVPPMDYLDLMGLA